MENSSWKKDEEHMDKINAVYLHILRNTKKKPPEKPILNKWALLVGKIYFSVVTVIFVSHHMYGTLAFYLIPGLLIIYISEYKWITSKK